MIVPRLHLDLLLCRTAVPGVVLALALTAHPAGASTACVPSVDLSEAPSSITLVGSAANLPDPAGRFVVVVRDCAGNRANGASVVVDFSQCPDVILCLDQLDPTPGALVNCLAKTTRKFTDVTGTAVFTILGSGNGAGSATSIGGCARITANGQLLKTARAATLDLDGTGGAGINDLSVWLTDFGSGVSYARDDFDHNGAVGINDLAVWLTDYASGASTQSCTSTCP